MSEVFASSIWPTVGRQTGYSSIEEKAANLEKTNLAITSFAITNFVIKNFVSNNSYLQISQS